MQHQQDHLKIPTGEILTMDPNANLAEQRTLAASILAMQDAAETRDLDAIAHDADRLAELVAVLAEWRQSGGFSPADPLTLNDAVTLGAILDCSGKQQPVTWMARYPEGDLITPERLISGTMRAVCADDQGRAFVGDRNDVRDGYVWISSTFEHFFPMRDVLAWVKSGHFFLNYRA